METSKLPIYHRIYLLLLQRINDGVYPADVKMPGELALAKEFSVARATVRAALARLEMENRLARKPGMGTFPLPQRRQATPKRAPLAVEDVELETALLQSEWVIPPARIRQQLTLGEGEKVMRLKRLCLHQQSPFCLVTLFVPEKVAATLKSERLEDTPVFFCLQELGYQPSFAEQTLSARLADGEVSRLLGIPEGAATIVYTNRVLNNEKAPLVVQQSLFNPARYEYLLSQDLQLTNDLPHWRPITD
ncbi:HTH-type transcriptional repressor DasR [Microbulbifer aestuariivivens]|uniref:HTH-type transcriptional repressor DasR n=1 Tax=Microbulbifer aestuariivivens TaxID=1908308 RepID=A0ABP9WS47_9GAMM